MLRSWFLFFTCFIISQFSYSSLFLCLFANSAEIYTPIVGLPTPVDPNSVNSTPSAGETLDQNHINNLTPVPPTVDYLVLPPSRVASTEKLALQRQKYGSTNSSVLMNNSIRDHKSSPSSSPTSKLLQNISSNSDNILNKETNSPIILDDAKALKNAQDSIKIVEPAIPSLEGEFGSWFVLTLKNDEGQKKCYMVSYPFDMVSNHTAIRRPYLMVLFDEFKRLSVYTATGYSLCKGSDVPLSIDGDKFILFAGEYIANTLTVLQDVDIINSMMSSARVMVYARSMIGTYSVDTYSLDGFVDGYEKMVSLCH